jgi:cardiolipin synthase
MHKLDRAGLNPLTAPAAAAINAVVMAPKATRFVASKTSEELAALTPEQKGTILRCLLRTPEGALAQGVLANLNGAVPQARNYDWPAPLPAEQDAVIKLLSSAKTDGQFDAMYFRAGSESLGRLTGEHAKSLERLRAQHQDNVRRGDWTGFEKYLDDLTGTKNTSGNKLELLLDGTEVVPRALEDLRNAKSSIDLQVYQWQMDDLSPQLVEELEKKQKDDGVKVRILLDENGTIRSAADKVQARAFIETMRAKGFEVVVNDSPRFLSSLDHRKQLVIDGTTAYTGDMNVGEDYQVNWHGQLTRMEGPAVGEIQSDFFKTWRASGGVMPSAEEMKLLFPALPTFSDGAQARVMRHAGNGEDRNLKAMYLRAIKTAADKIEIEVPYFGDADVANALEEAAREKVSTKIIFPAINDQRLSQLDSRSYYNELIAANVEVYEYNDRMTHLKVGAFDESFVTFGSTNLDARSFEFNDELNIGTSDKRFAKDVQTRLFDVDLANSTRILEHKPRPAERLKENGARVIENYL